MFKNKKAMIIIGVMAVAFSIIAFFIPFDKNENFWVAYIFGLTAFLIQVPVFKIAFEEKDTAKSKFLGLPVFRIGYIYLFVQTVVSFALIIAGGYVAVPVWLSTVICVLVLTTALVFSISGEIAREAIEKIDDSVKVSTSAMNELRNKSGSLSAYTNDAALKSELKKLAESFKYSDPVSSDETLQAERELLKDLDNLTSMLSDGSAVADDIKSIQEKLSIRNEICKSSKKR